MTTKFLSFFPLPYQWNAKLNAIESQQKSFVCRLLKSFGKPPLKSVDPDQTAPIDIA